MEQKLRNIVQTSMKKYVGGNEYFDNIDTLLKLPKNKDIIEKIFKQIQKEQGDNFNLILSGKFGEYILNLIKRKELLIPDNVVLTNGSLRKTSNGKIDQIVTKDVDIIHKDKDLDNKRFIFFDDSYYSGSTKNSLEKYLKKFNSDIYKTYVLYDGNNIKDKNRFSLYRYYDYNFGTILPVDKLIDYLYGLNVDVPKDNIKNEILKGNIKTLKDVRKNIIELQKNFNQDVSIPLNLTHKEETNIIKKFEDFNYDCYSFIINYNNKIIYK
jgi:hypothetical protein